MLSTWGSPRQNACVSATKKNDIEMLKNVGYGVAMANAIPEVKAVARLTTASNEEDGVAKMINQVVSGQFMEE
ncbi:HAD hydrolase family protein [Lacticaseibacillus camelliae]|uniref:HAD hydrolase family protein n=1 Tax=Lacticaseibacillus camelliae TaxID=381742 RepID=UPI00138F1CF8